MAGTKPVQAGEGKERRHLQQQQQVGIHHSCRCVKNSHENSKPKTTAALLRRRIPDLEAMRASICRERARAIPHQRIFLKKIHKNRKTKPETPKKHAKGSQCVLLYQKLLKTTSNTSVSDQKNNGNRSQMATAKTRNGQKLNKKARLYFVPAKLKG
jgi:hypothetical protein